MRSAPKAETSGEKEHNTSVLKLQVCPMVRIAKGSHEDRGVRLHTTLAMLPNPIQGAGYRCHTPQPYTEARSPTELRGHHFQQFLQPMNSYSAV